MKKKKLLISAMLILMSVSMAHGQTTNAYVYVQQNNAKVTTDGTASVEVPDAGITLGFSGNDAVMKVGGAIVAQLPVVDANGGELCADFTSSTGAGSLPVTVTSAGYATIYSPFQLVVPSNVEVYSSTLSGSTLSFTKVDEGTVLPVCKGFLLKGTNGTPVTDNFPISVGSASNIASALSGTSLLINKPSVETGYSLYTLGYESTTNVLGFYSYIGETLRAGGAYLIAPTIGNARDCYDVSFDGGTVTAINAMNNEQLIMNNGKFIINGQVVIIKNGKKFNLNGQEIK